MGSQAQDPPDQGPAGAQQEEPAGGAGPAAGVPAGPFTPGPPGPAAAPDPRPATRPPSRPPAQGRRPFAAAGGLPALPIVSKPLISPRLSQDPRLGIWIARALICLALFLGFAIWLDWRIGLSAAVVYAVADTIYRSKTMTTIPASVRVTSAQRRTRRRLSVLRAAGYLSLHACQIPGTGSIIDHIVVGPAGVFSMDSERLDHRLTVRAKGGMLYHGPLSQEGRLDHAREEARHAATRIGAELGHPVRVRPVMVTYGPDVPWIIMRIKGVDVLDGGRIGTYFRRQSKETAGHQLSAGQIAVIFAAAARALPPIR